MDHTFIVDCHLLLLFLVGSVLTDTFMNGLACVGKLRTDYSIMSGSTYMLVREYVVCLCHGAFFHERRLYTNQVS